jgi:glycosyltransferase involved in cell wall biosynthesis
MKSLNYKVSVCIITYNHKDYIRECIDGVISQIIDSKYEIVIGDDCSTDGTSEICVEYAAKYPELIRFVRRNTNLGMVGNWIATIKDCQGNYIAPCEGDDYWTDPYKLQKQVDLIEQYPNASMCVALVEHFKQNKNQFTKDKPYQGKHYPLAYGFDGLNQYFHTSTYLIRRDVIVYLLSNYSSLFLGDTALRYLLIERGPFVILNQYVSCYRDTGTGIWTSLNQLQKDKAHYHLHHIFREKFVKNQLKHHLNLEIHYLKSIINLHKNKGISTLNFVCLYYYLVLRFYPKLFVKLTLKRIGIYG